MLEVRDSNKSGCWIAVGRDRELRAQSCQPRLREPAIQKAQENQQADIRDGGAVDGDRPACVQRLRVLGKGGLLEVQRIAHQKSFANFADAAQVDLQKLKFPTRYPTLFSRPLVPAPWRVALRVLSVRFFRVMKATDIGFIPKPTGMASSEIRFAL